ncbi:hypothetical protein L0Y46_03985 [bacterium]|nr:hypothetical protein [bacterium]
MPILNGFEPRKGSVRACGRGNRRGSHFYVPPRLENDLETILQYFTEKPWWKQQYHGMFTPLDFRMDISSTEIRKNAAE